MQPREILDIVELCYYVIALPLSAYVTFRHGFGRSAGWIYLCILGILRIIGGAAGIYYYESSNPSTGVLETSTIAVSIGISPLLLSLMGILQRLNESMGTNGLPKNGIRAISLPIMVGLILAIVGGTKEFNSNPSTAADGLKFVKAASILWLLGFILLMLVALWTVSRHRSILNGEQRLIFAAVLSLPFILVRIIYSVLSAFDNTSSAFSIKSTSNTAVIVDAIMSALMEFIVVAMFLAAGLTVRKIPTNTVQNSRHDPSGYTGNEQANGRSKA